MLKTTATTTIMQAGCWKYTTLICTTSFTINFTTTLSYGTRLALSLVSGQALPTANYQSFFFLKHEIELFFALFFQLK